MTEVYGLPQPLTGTETVTIQQLQNGQLALCTMPLSGLLGLLTVWAASLPTTTPSSPGIVWNDNGAVSIS